MTGNPPHYKTSDTRHIIIIGGVAGGASAAARLRRLDEGARITLIERGPDVSFANCGLPYFIGGEIVDRGRLSLQTPDSLQAQLAIDVRSRTEAAAIDRRAKTVRIRNVETGKEEELTYDALILSPGASPLRLPLERVELPGIHTLRSLQDMDRIKEAARSARRVLVIGAGFIGLEMAEQIVRLEKEVTLAEIENQVLPQMDPEMVRPVEQELLERGVRLLLNERVTGFGETEGGALEARFDSGRRVAADLIILSVGVRPESGLAREAGIELGERGHVSVNAYMQTSDPDIYAVGDVCETADPILGGLVAAPLGGPANRQGRVAADHIVQGGSARPYPGSIGTAIVRVFDVAAGVTGYTEKRLTEMGMEYEKTIVTDFNRAGFFPGATHLSVKILWEKSTGRLLGGQVNGSDGVDKRLDVLATAIRGKLTVDDLEHLELAYAPPFGAAKDPLNTAGFSANNIRSGRLKPIYSLPDSRSTQLLDVRPAEMARLAPIPGAVNIPYQELRGRLEELDRSRPVAAVCALGKLSYFTARILDQKGFEAHAHVGGWRVVNPPKASEGLQPVLPAQDVEEAGTDSGGEVIKLDATGMACPGPILRVREHAARLESGQILEVTASDAGFKTDFPAFCKANSYECLGVEKSGGIVTGRLRKGKEGSADSSPVAQAGDGKGSTIVVFSGELDKAMAAFVIANGAIAMGGKATLFFTFWGLNVLRKDPAPTVAGKTFMDKMFGWMLPRGAERLPLSNMHMAGMGTRMMKGRMRSKDLPNLPDLMRSAKESGVRLVACTMSMEAMGIREEELIDGVELGGVAEFLGSASETRANLFI